MFDVHFPSSREKQLIFREFWLNATRPPEISVFNRWRGQSQPKHRKKNQIDSRDSNGLKHCVDLCIETSSWLPRTRGGGKTNTKHPPANASTIVKIGAKRLVDRPNSKANQNTKKNSGQKTFWLSRCSTVGYCECWTRGEARVSFRNEETTTTRIKTGSQYSVGKAAING